METSFPEPRVHSDLGQAIASFSKSDIIVSIYVLYWNKVILEL